MSFSGFGRGWAPRAGELTDCSCALTFSEWRDNEATKAGEAASEGSAQWGCRGAHSGFSQGRTPCPVGQGGEDPIPSFRGTRISAPRAVAEPVLRQDSPYGQAIVTRDTEHK